MTAPKAPRNDVERRRYFRIEDKVVLSYKTLSEEEKQLQSRKLQSGEDLCPDLYHIFVMLESDIQDLIKKSKKENLLLSQAIELLNRKLNVIAKGLPNDRRKNSSIFNREPVTVSLSGCGISFMAPTPIEKGQTVQIEIILLPSRQYIVCLGEIVSSEKVALSENISYSAENPFRIAVNFVEIRGEDSERLIQHVIKREVELLRASKKHLRS
ncbi:MAG: PilZ domain-containing protein [Candidatus Berkiella sp.]